MPRRSPYTIELSDEERRILEARGRRCTLPYRDVVRAQMVLLAAGGLRNDEIARRLNTRREVVSMAQALLRGARARPRGASAPGQAADFSPQRCGLR